ALRAGGRHHPDGTGEAVHVGGGRRAAVADRVSGLGREVRAVRGRRDVLRLPPGRLDGIVVHVVGRGAASLCLARARLTDACSARARHRAPRSWTERDALCEIFWPAGRGVDVARGPNSPHLSPRGGSYYDVRVTRVTRARLSILIFAAAALFLCVT